MRSRFDEQLALLNRELIEMGALCEEAIALASRALMEGDQTLPARVSQEGGPLGRAPRMSVLAQLYVLMSLSVLLQSRVGQTPAEYLRCHPGGALGKSGLGIEPGPASDVSYK